jgi:hypothetical protein
MPESLPAVVARASERYTNGTALFQWAKERGFFTETPAHELSYDEIVPVFGGSCVEQLRMLMRDVRLDTILHSTRMHGAEHSEHRAAVTSDNGRRILLDPNLCPVAISLDELMHEGELVIPTYPLGDGQHTEVRLSKTGDKSFEIMRVNVRGEHKRTRRHEGMNFGSTESALPDVGTDILHPMLHNAIVAEVTLPEDAQSHREVVIVHRKEGQNKMWLEGKATRVKADQQIGEYLDAAAAVCGTTRDVLLQFLVEGERLLNAIARERRDIFDVVSEAVDRRPHGGDVITMATSLNSLRADESDIANAVYQVSQKHKVALDTRTVWNPARQTVGDVVRAIHERGTHLKPA